MENDSFYSRAKVRFKGKLIIYTQKRYTHYFVHSIICLRIFWNILMHYWLEMWISDRKYVFHILILQIHVSNLHNKNSFWNLFLAFLYFTLDFFELRNLSNLFLLYIYMHVVVFIIFKCVTRVCIIPKLI